MGKVGHTIWHITKYLCGCTKQQADFMRDLEENLQFLEAKWKDLEAMKNDVEAKIKADEETGEMQRSHAVSLWLENIQNIQEDIAKIRVKAQAIQNHCILKCGVKCWSSSSPFGKKVAKKLREVEDLNTKGLRFGGHYQITYKLPRKPIDKITQGTQVPLVPPPSSMVFELSPRRFTYEELELATEGFSESNFLGQGGFGPVHKGILRNKQILAIKQLKYGSKQGMPEFQAEVNVVSRVHHKHLVSLAGYYFAEAPMMLMLVYEFVPNKTLDFHLHEKGTETLDWSTRMKIANGSAKALAYLHDDCQPKIIHRDIKAANILLDDKFEPKIADFGLAKLSSDTDTHVSTAIKGTFGYLAPDYAANKRLSEKADVYSFGVVLLELIAGQKPVLETGCFPDNSLVERARLLLPTALRNRNFEVLADPRLQNNYNSEEMFRMASCAAKCVRHLPDHRPRMSQVMDALTGKINLDNWN